MSAMSAMSAMSVGRVLARVSGAGVVAAATLVIGTGTAPAAASDDFGQHVAACARTMGFDGDHNPGMHQGRRGWDPAHSC